MNSLVDLKDSLPLVTHVVDVTFRLVRRPMTVLTVVPLLTFIMDMCGVARCL